MVSAITSNTFAVIAISALLILILTRTYFRWKNLQPSEAEILEAFKERIVLLQEKLALLIERITWTNPEELEIRARHRGLALTKHHVLHTKMLCKQMIDYLSKAIAYYPEQIRQEIGGVEAAANISRAKDNKAKCRALAGKSTNQTATTIKPENWK